MNSQAEVIPYELPAWTEAAHDDRAVHFRRSLMQFRDQFAQLLNRYPTSAQHSMELDAVIDAYTAFVTNTDHELLWTELMQPSSVAEELTKLAAELRASSSLCVGIAEKYRALKLLSGHTEGSDYFHHVEASIGEPFGSFPLTSDSTVIWIGSGAFPMTALFLARQTGATIIGIDIDAEAISLGRKVVERLGAGLDIRLELAPAEQLPEIGKATHLIFSSTVPEKFELLDQLHACTGRQIVAAVRYGNGLKSLFNYPMAAVDERKWRLAEHVSRSGRVFDLALYQQA
ncbi:class I SAM-dependent methyltransferase [Paenibacillus sp. YYML68]|uniref:class I SAM-dependent methyltransferase n=1 Tax=Paenibacillus sp. YYML68 TaxID=2909250 RepID=UPI0024902C0A|nr:class I SAM-dependent methyltransferase [Paenibacillus sp. YYML68]